jgi:signal transduction histidine kinase
MPLRVGESFQERVIDFPQGSTVFLYTDGLVERRGRALLDGLDELRLALAGLVVDAKDPEAACDDLIKRLTGGAHDDDVALLFAREAAETREVAVMELNTNPLIAAAGRRFVTQALEEWKLVDLQPTAGMVVTELISNAVRHTGRPLTLRLQHRERRLIVKVADGDERQQRRLQPALLDEGHRGLFIVDKLSRRWGARPTATGKVVWAELVHN